MKRDYSLDFLRIVACILVIVIHVANVYCRAYTNIDSVNYIGAIIFNTIARVSVPIFFMISGALLIKPSEFNIKKYLQRIWRLLFALIAWNFIYFLFNKYYLGNDLNFYDSFIESFVEPTKRHLWFMYAIIGIYIILPFVQNMCKNLSKQEENLFMGLWLFFVGVVYIIKLELKLEINYLIPIIQGTYYLGYFVVGSILYRRIKEKKLDNKWHKFLILLSIMCYVITIVGSCYLSFKHDKYYNLLLGYRSIYYMLSSISIYLLFINNKEKFRENKLITSISGLSFGIYLIHPVFLNLITENIEIINQISYAFIPLYTVVIFILSYIACLIIKKIPYINKILG